MHDFIGYCAVEVVDEQLGLAFPLAVFYPSATPGRAQLVGPYALDVARGAAIEAGRFPLVLLSHGTGSAPLAYRALAQGLARRGFVVGLPEHPFNHRDDNSWAGTAQNLAARPRHLQLAIDALYGNSRFTASLKPDAVGLVGHSMGGYTALALAGGRPASVPRDSPNGVGQAIPVPAADARVKALVLLAPATPWFAAAGALRNVKVPILLLEAEKDEHAGRFHGQVVLTGIEDRGLITHRIVENAGHFSFLSPFPAARVSPAFPPSQDPPGFDRAGFQEELAAEVAAFFARQLT